VCKGGGGDILDLSNDWVAESEYPRVFSLKVKDSNPGLSLVLYKKISNESPTWFCRGRFSQPEKDEPYKLSLVRMIAGPVFEEVALISSDLRTAETESILYYTQKVLGFMRHIHDTEEK